MTRSNPITTTILAAAALLWVGLAPHTAYGQASLVDDDDDLDEPAAEQSARAEPEAKLGLGVRLRQVFIPKAILDLFWTAPGGGSHTGIGAEFVRQKGDRALVIGVEYEKLEAVDRQLWVERGERPIDGVDYVDFDNFRWLTLDVSIIWHADLTSMFSLRYGVGIGAGLLLGTVIRTDYTCDDVEEPSFEACSETPDGETQDDVPAVAPVLNMLVGLQFRPVGNIAINLEGGIRTIPFAGTSVSILF